MTNPLNRIGINSLAIGSNFEGGAKSTKPEVEEPEEQTSALPEAKPQLSPEDVLGFLAASAISHQPNINYEALVNKYNTQAQITRIEESMKTFEENILPTLKSEYDFSDKLIDMIAAGIADRL